MSVCFCVTPGSNRRDVAEDDARPVQMARRVTAARLRYCGPPHLVDDATLIVSKLVTNAIVHSSGAQVTLTLAVRDGSLLIAVHDETPDDIAVHHAGSDDERGRGLFLVGYLANAHNGGWGTSDKGATTWCRLSLAWAQQ
ncbi:ATP-binding protein [Streptomyces sp. NPDC046831]|uniref:ATP-binding protein n=1 Tax=Streptomyces sp. NPDC046831 TaxID=3154805 RepID=UPI0033E8C571